MKESSEQLLKMQSSEHDLCLDDSLVLVSGAERYKHWLMTASKLIPLKSVNFKKKNKT